MNMTTIILVNLGLALLTLLAVAGVVRLAHRLPSAVSGDDADWGRGGDPWVPSEPLPLAQLRAHETERELARAA
jgi:hypothetical protein